MSNHHWSCAQCLKSAAKFKEANVPDKDGRTLRAGDRVRHWTEGFDDPVAARVLQVLADDRYLIEIDRVEAEAENMDVEQPTAVDGSTLEYLRRDGP
jgi:hypothetical protein